MKKLLLLYILYKYKYLYNILRIDLYFFDTTKKHETVDNKILFISYAAYIITEKLCASRLFH